MFKKAFLIIPFLFSCASQASEIKFCRLWKTTSGEECKDALYVNPQQFPVQWQGTFEDYVLVQTDGHNAGKTYKVVNVNSEKELNAIRIVLRIYDQQKRNLAQDPQYYENYATNLATEMDIDKFMQDPTRAALVAKMKQKLGFTFPLALRQADRVAYLQRHVDPLMRRRGGYDHHIEVVLHLN